MTATVVLAAGDGKRMHSVLPKVLHPVLEQPMLAHVLRAVQTAELERPLVVIGRNGDQVQEAFAGQATFVWQDPPRGTGDALRVALQHLPSEGQVLVISGDTPLWRAETLRDFMAAVPTNGSGLVCTEVTNPTGYGRIVRRDQRFLRVVEEQDASAEQRKLKEVNAGLYLLDSALARKLLDELDTANAQGEVYLTDLLALMAQQAPFVAWTLADATEMAGVNDRRQLAAATTALRQRIINHWLEHSVSVLDPVTTWIGAEVELGQDVVIGPGVRILGKSRIGQGSRIGAGTEIVDAKIGADAQIRQSVIENSEVGDRVTIGPFAHLRPGCVVAADVEIGNFAELKNTRIGSGSKAHHHCYLGDAEIGQRVNIGAGAITVNYDGIAKHQTVIGDGAFVGCNANLIAPLLIGPGAYVAAGSTVTQEVPAQSLAVARERQRNIEGWAKRRFGSHKEE